MPTDAPMPDPTDDNMSEFLKAMKNPLKLSEVMRGASLDLGQAMEREEQRRKDEAERREAERFKAAVAAYEHFGWTAGSKRTPAYSCPACSAVVRDRERHQRWHDAMDESAQKADSAYWHNQPIG